MKKTKGFTLSEVVITLIVIGVVSAITIPMLHNNADEKKWNAARQKAQATIGEAFKLMTVNGEIDNIKSTEDFVKSVIPKYLKLANICAVSEAKKCGMSTTSNFYKRPDDTRVTLPTSWGNSTTARILNGNPPNSAGTFGSSTIYNHSLPNTNDSYMFRTMDGFSVNFFYNPYCVSDGIEKYVMFNNNSENSERYYAQYSMDVICMMGVYDMNGIQGPNKVGMDIGFVGSFYNEFQTKSASVLPGKTDNSLNNMTISQGMTYCKNLDKNGTWKLPSIDELSLLYLNKTLVNLQNNFYPSSTIEPYLLINLDGRSGSDGDGRRLRVETKNMTTYAYSWRVRCVYNDK